MLTDTWLKMHRLRKYLIIVTTLALTLGLLGCKALKPKYVDARETPINASEKVIKNLEEGRGFRVGTGMGGLTRGTTFDFATSNPLWRASIDLLDFAPFDNVDYAGGIIVTDWYNSSSEDNEYIKITVKFLSTEIRADGIEVIVHKKICDQNNRCKTEKIKSKIESELKLAILKKAAELKNLDVKKFKEKHGKYPAGDILTK